MSNLQPTPYKLSFTGASLEINRSIKLAETYLISKDWQVVHENVWSQNLLQARTHSSIQRVYQELQPRLAELDLAQLSLLVEGNPHEQRQLLWFAICQRYLYIREFAMEVIREKYLRMDYELTDFDYDSFFLRKADWHLELERLKDSSRQKIKTRLFHMSKEAGLINMDNRILPALLTHRILQVLAPYAPDSLMIFPLTDAEISLAKADHEENL
jgi:hypothetical protein